MLTIGARYMGSGRTSFMNSMRATAGSMCLGSRRGCSSDIRSDGYRDCSMLPGNNFGFPSPDATLPELLDTASLQ